MAIRDGHLDEKEFQRMIARGDDTQPIMASVPEPPASHWGKLTSQSRTLSPAYAQFLKKHKESKDGRRV